MKRIKIFALAAVILALSCASAYADIFYTVAVDDAYSACGAGVLAGSGYTVSKDLVVGLAGDTRGYSFKDRDGAQKVLVREYSFGPNDGVSIYTPGKWGVPDVNKNVFGTNIHGVATTENKLYIAAYERFDGEADKSGEVIRVSDSYEPDASYQFDPSQFGYDDETYKIRPVAITAYGGNIYVVVSTPAADYSFGNSYVVKFDSDLKRIGTPVRIGNNAGGMYVPEALYNGTLYIGCTGKNPYSSDFEGAGFWAVNLNDMTPQQLIDLSADDSLGAQMAYGASIKPDGTVFLLLSDTGAPGAIYITTVGALSASGVSTDKAGSSMAAFTPLSGYSFGALYDESTETLWVMNGKHLQAYDKNGATLLRDLTPELLGGNIYSLALIDDAGGSSGGGGGSGGGCDAGAFGYFGAFALLALAASSKCRGK
jgi:hypothetical protein